MTREELKQLASGRDPSSFLAWIKARRDAEPPGDYRDLLTWAAREYAEIMKEEGMKIT